MNNFNQEAINLFRIQSKENPVYKQYINYLGINPNKIENINQIPFLPVEFFKNHKIITGTDNGQYDRIFGTSGTSSGQTGFHYVKDINLYHKAALLGFEHFYGPITDYTFLALLPSYLERDNSSLVEMANYFMQKSEQNFLGFYLNDFAGLKEKLIELISNNKKVILIGVTFALLDFAEKYSFDANNNFIIMETGGMKGRRKEILRQEVHKILKEAFNLKNIHSEYGMTELLSQAYSFGDGIYNESPTMKILIRDASDPFLILDNEKQGAINIIDLANKNSCAFIETMDLGIKHIDQSFEVLGRMDRAQIRGCNLMYA